MTQKKYKVGIFIDTFFPNLDGVVIGIDSLAKFLNKHIDLTVFTAAPRNGIYDDRGLGYKVVRCKSRKIPFVKKIDYDWPMPKNDKAFCKALKESELDLVHIHSPFAVGEIGLKYAKKHKIPSVMTVHSQYKKDFFKATSSKLITIFMMNKIMKVVNACDECWSVNESSKEILYEYGINKQPVTMENGTDMIPLEDKSETFGIDKSQKVLLYVGRLVHVKNIFFIADVLKHLKSTDLNFKMIFVGTGADKDELQRVINKYELSNDVVFAGLVKDRNKLAQYYARADLFIFPSFYDTDGVVKKEAACQKTPIICVQGSIVAKSVSDGHNAYIGPDDAAGFAGKIVDILNDTKKHKEVSENAFKELYIKWTDTAQKTLERYKMLIEKPTL